MTVKHGRVVYAFNPTPSFLEKIAKVSGPRPILLSYYYLKKKNGLKTLEEWRKYSQPWILILDSGVYSLRNKLKLGMTATSGASKEFSKEDREHIFSQSLQQKDLIDKHVKDYIQFLHDAEGLYDVAVEMDMDDWMGVGYSDIYYKWMCEKISSHKIMRVWHQSGRTFEDWLEWVKDSTQSYLCVEGGTILGRNVELYNKFIYPAQQAGKKVHILAMTIPQILRDTPVNTTDSSTFINGGRFGTIKVPGLGEITFSNRTDLSKSSPATARHYVALAPNDLDYCKEYFRTMGYSFDDILNHPESHYLRVVLTLAYYDEYVDVPYVEKPSHVEIF